MKTRRYSKLIKELSELRQSMVENGRTEQSATFLEVEEWAGMPLPPSAYTHRAWWSNNISNGNYSNSLKPWDTACLSTAEVDMAAKTVVFQLWSKDVELARKNQPPFDRAALLSRPKTRQTVVVRPPPGLEDVQRLYEGQTYDHHPLRGALKGTLRIVAGTDLTLPADPDWADAP